jgi:aminoglycoside phosphotransferase (APT) family kinase protein
VKVAEGREAEMFAWEDGKILRLLRDPAHAGSLQWESAAARAALAGGVRVPKSYETLAVNGRPGIVVERINGKDLLAEIAAKPWRVWAIGRTCGRVHAHLNSVDAGRELPDVRERLAGQIRRSGEIPERFKEYALRELEELPGGDRLLHGDFHPGNVLRAGDDLFVIDWPNATRGDFHADYARTTLMMQLGDPPPSSNWVIRYGATFARFILLWSYKQGYTGQMDVSSELHRRWELVRAIHRLAECIESERGKLLRFIEQRLESTPGA